MSFVFRSLFNQRLCAILLLGFASGLPLALTGSTLQAWFTQSDINIISIGALSLVGLPYTLKFLWAPIMDYFRFPHWGTRKSWMLIAQIGIVICLFVMANLNPAQGIYSIGLCALLLAFFSASQDISITAYQADVLLQEERGMGVAYYVFAYRIATLISGGFALIIADYFGWKLTYQLMALVMILAMIATAFIPRANETQPNAGDFLHTVYSALMDFWNREKFLILLLFIMFYKFGDALALQLITNFLLHGLGFTLTEIGLVYKVVSILALILGAFVGGIILTRWNIYKALLIFGIAQSISNLLFAVLAFLGKNFIFMAISVFIENFCSGLSTAALFAFMMSLCNHRFTATQFAILSTFASVGRVFLGPLAGIMVLHLGWIEFFVSTFIICFPGIIFLILLKDEMIGYSHALAK